MANKRIFIIGAGVSGINIFQILNDINEYIYEPEKEYHMEGYIDENSEYKGKKLFDKKIYIGFDSLKDRDFLDYYVICALDDSMYREKMLKQAEKLGFKIDTVIHPSAQVSNFAKIGKGVIICQNCVIQPYAEIGDFCYIHEGDIVGPRVKINHSSTINNLVSISANTHIGKRSNIGGGSIIVQNIKIGEETIIGPNSVVLKSIPANVTAMGNPAKIIKEYPEKNG